MIGHIYNIYNDVVLYGNAYLSFHVIYVSFF